MVRTALTPIRLAALLVVVPCADVAAAQIPVLGPDTTGVVAESDDVAGAARAAQALFERRRVNLLPLRVEPFGGHCDEVVGRLCTTFSEGEWYPTPEAPEIGDLRTELVATLDTLQGMDPANEWILGQRVWYRYEAGDLEAALETARQCGAVEPGLCLALEGFALHALGRYVAAETAFGRALARMDPAERREWSVPKWTVDSDLRDLLRSVDPESRQSGAILDWMWLLADPLYLVQGNDRKTEHYARHTVARLRDRARNPFRLSWGSDLEELTLRHGWEMGWERSPSRDFSGIDQVVGHKHPEGRDYMPPGRAVIAPPTASADELRADLHRPRSLYAPAYAPVLLPMEGQVAVFPRGSRTVIVTSHYLPEDTTFHSDHAHPLPWMVATPAEAATSDRIGLFAVAVDGGDMRQVVRRRRTSGGLMIDVPTGDYVVSAESWSPAGHRAGRVRLGVPRRDAPADVATLSDLLFVSTGERAPESLEEAVERVLERPVVRPGQSFTLAWEATGLGFRPESLIFEVSIERTDRGILDRLGGFLRLTDRPRPLALSWDEPGPGVPRSFFRSLSLDLPTLDPGRYRVRLILRTSQRSDAIRTADFRVVAPR